MTKQSGVAPPDGSTPGFRGLLRVGRLVRTLRIRGIPRLLYTLSRRVRGPYPRLFPSISGVLLSVDLRNYPSCMMIYDRFFPELIRTIEGSVDEGSAVVDVGAHLGFVTAHLARTVGPAGVVYSFEPDPHALRQLYMTIAGNRLDWVKVFPMALGDQTCTLPFNLSPHLGWSTAVPDSHHRDMAQVMVPCTTLDELRKQGGVPERVAFVKIDVEGFECRVLQGMSLMLVTDRPVLLVEANELMLAANGDSAVKLLEGIVHYGYRILRVVERRAWWHGGSPLLLRLDPGTPPPFCDVLCLPEERPAPAGLIVA